MKPDKRIVDTGYIELKHRDTGARIYSHNEPGNTVAHTLMLALLHGTDIRHADLSGADLSFGHYVDKNFAHCDLSGTTLTGANFTRARLDKASLSFVKDSHLASFQEATFHGTFAAGSNFRNSFFTNALGQECNFGEVSRNGVVVIKGSDFSGADLRGFATRGAGFRGITIDNDTLLDGIDSRIAYRSPRVKVTCVCGTESCGTVCRQCK